MERTEALKTVIELCAVYGRDGRLGLLDDVEMDLLSPVQAGEMDACWRSAADVRCLLHRHARISDLAWRMGAGVQPPGHREVRETIERWAGPGEIAAYGLDLDDPESCRSWVMNASSCGARRIRQVLRQARQALAESA